jgi:hypothetical protein
MKKMDGKYAKNEAKKAKNLYKVKGPTLLLTLYLLTH